MRSTLSIGGTNGAAGMPSPTHQNLFIFMHFSETNWPNNSLTPPLWVCAPVWEILDPPLLSTCFKGRSNILLPNLSTKAKSVCEESGWQVRPNNRQSSCVNASDIPPVAYQVFPLLSYPGGTPSLARGYPISVWYWVPGERTWDQSKHYGMEMGYPLHQVWTDKQTENITSHRTSYAGGNNRMLCVTVSSFRRIFGSLSPRSATWC